MKTLRFEAQISDSHADALETIKSLLMTEPDTGITNDSTLEEIFYECANVGLAILSQQMMDEGIYDKHREEVELGKKVDDILEDL